MKVNFNIFLLLFVLVAGNTSAQKSPNIIYIICDDLGYGDVQFLNPKRGKISTPNIDKLATQGMTFTDAHAGSSVCTPTRYGVLTGRYAWRTQLQSGVLRGGREFEPLIDKDRLTVPALLKKAGYSTACMGKWHLGFKFEDEDGKELVLQTNKYSSGAPIGAIVPNGPINRGFDTYFGFHHSATMRTVIKNDRVIDDIPTIAMLGLLGDNASEYIANVSKKGNPFFLYLALNSPHSPVVPSAKWQGKSGIGPYGDFVMETDHTIGRVMKALEEHGITDNTLVFLTSDNGCSYPVAKGKKLETVYGHYASAQFRGSKSDIWEGGHRVPFIVSWPEKVSPNSRNNALICLTSLMATCAEITGQALPKNAGEDSQSILPLLLSKKNADEHQVVVHHSIEGKFSIRKGEWKMNLCPGSGGWTYPKDTEAKELFLPEIQLYNIEKDESETNNVFESYPEIVKELTNNLEKIVDKGHTVLGKTSKNDVHVDIFKKNE
ncbi:MAG: arylsulfatase [Bacteroidota bacterium]